MAGPRCTICSHEERATIDQMLARGTLSLRAIANQFGVGRNALARHQETHLIKAVQRQVRRQQEREEEELGSVWRERLHETYEAARRGAERAETDRDQWASGARFLAVVAKVVETGLKADGVIEGASTMPKVNVEQVIVLPMGRPQVAELPTVIPAKAIAEHGDE
jgi:transposase-like protein